MNQVFLLVVAAIVTISLIGLGTGLFNSVLPDNSELTTKSLQALENATIRPGHTFGPLAIAVPNGTSITTQRLNGQFRQVAFSCLDETLCCTTEKNCSKPLTVFSNRVYSNDKTTTFVSARCDGEKPVSGCVIFLGNTPAQLSVELTNPPATYDLTNGTTLNVNTTIYNQGSLVLSNPITIESIVEKEIIENGVSNYSLAKGNQIAVKKTLKEKESATALVPVSLLSEGKYRVTIKASSSEAGFDSQLFRIEVVGKATLCETEVLVDQPDDNLCPVKATCKDGCVAAFECENAWQKKYADLVFEARTPQYACEVSSITN